MLIENDFEHDDGHRQPDAPASPPPPPLVVIQYRNRGIPLLLVPPVLILAAVLGFQAHRRMTPPRPVLVLPPVLAADEDRPPEDRLDGRRGRRPSASWRGSSRPPHPPSIPWALPRRASRRARDGPRSRTAPPRRGHRRRRIRCPPRPSRSTSMRRLAETPAPADPAAPGPDPPAGPVLPRHLRSRP